MSSTNSIMGKIVTPILMACCVFCLFGGWITFKSSTTKELVKSSVESLTDEMDDISELEYELEAEGINFSASKLARHAKQLVSIVKDGSISPYEVAFKTGIFIDIVEISENNRSFFGSSLPEGVSVVVGLIWATRVFFVLTVLYYIIAIIMTIKGGRYWNIFPIILNLGWFAVWALVTAGINSSIRSESFLMFDDVLTVTFISFLPVILSILCLIFALKFNKKNYGTQYGGYNNVRPQYANQNGQYNNVNSQYGYQSNVQYGGQSAQYGNQNVQYGYQNNQQYSQYGNQNAQYGNQNAQYGYQNNQQYSQYDSQKTVAAVKYCPACRMANASNVKYCSSCGSPL